MVATIFTVLGVWFVVGLAVAAVTKQLAAKHWLYQLFISVDQLLNVLLTPFHSGTWADETLSSRAYRAHSSGKRWGRLLMPAIDTIFFWQERHCEGAYIKERERIHMAPESRL